jgi:hypothetical protein
MKERSPSGFRRSRRIVGRSTRERSGQKERKLVIVAPAFFEI